jgi:hypothetical protein
MILIQLKGGLGNQMFQYAAARALAAKHGIKVLLDATHYREDQLRNFDLLELNVAARLASSKEADEMRPNSPWQRVIARLTPSARKTYYKQPYYHFDPDFFRLGPRIYLQGYFQSERYFQPIKDVIRQELTFRNPMPANVQELAAQMRREASVSVHIRRGDYKNAETLRMHGMLPLSYYDEAVKGLQNDLPSPHFYIFTDDSRWVKENLDLPGATLVSGPVTHTHFEDLYLMQQCRHNIIANSSFSWWGAWLNDSPEKKVIAPKNWFNEGPKDTQDLIPASWKQI